PFLVVIITTPFAALEPYNVEAAASFNTLKLSISLGLMELRSPLNGIPSTTYSGLAEALIEPNPRTRTVASEPGCPEPKVETTPGAAPSKALVILVIGLFSIVSAFTVATDPVKAERVDVP